MRGHDQGVVVGVETDDVLDARELGAVEGDDAVAVTLLSFEFHLSDFEAKSAEAHAPKIALGKAMGDAGDGIGAKVRKDVLVAADDRVLNIAAARAGIERVEEL